MMLLAHNNLKSEFDNLYDTIKNYANNGIPYTEIYKLLESRFSGTKQQFYLIYRSKKELKTIQNSLDLQRENIILKMLNQGDKILNISQTLSISRSVIYDIIRKHNLDCNKKNIVKKISTELYIPKKIHDTVPTRKNDNFATFLYQKNHIDFANDLQCLNIFPAIDSRGDYWCGNYRDAGNPSRQKQRYCTDCHKIVFSKKGG